MLLSSKTLHLAGTTKLRSRLVGPFRVLERVGKSAYRLDLRGRFQDVYNVIHVSYLRNDTPGGSSENPSEPIQVESEEHFEVKALLQHRSRGNSR